MTDSSPISARRGASAFFIERHPDGTPIDPNVCELLTEVYLGEGFTSPELAQRAFTPAALAARGSLWTAKPTGGAALAGVVFLAESMSPFRQVANDDEAEVQLLAVRSAHRRGGLAAALVGICVEEARRRGMKRLVLSTQATMANAQRLYERLGFVRAPERDWLRQERSFWVYLAPL